MIEETVEAILCCKLSAQPAKTSCTTSLSCASSGDEGSQNHYNWYHGPADQGQGPIPFSHQQSPGPSFDDVDEWINTILDHPDYSASSAAFPQCDTSVYKLDYDSNECHNITENCNWNNIDQNLLGSNLEEHLVRIKRQRQEEAMARRLFLPPRSMLHGTHYPSKTCCVCLIDEMA